MQPHDDILLTVVWSENVNVALGKSGVPKALCHGLGRRRNAADRIGRVDLDELFENVMRKTVTGFIGLHGGLGMDIDNNAKNANE
jgi:hypothetical protein